MATANEVVLKVLNDLNEKTGLGGVIESWKDISGNWYQKFYDGLILQGGFVEETSANVTVSLNKEFSSTNYFCVGVIYTPSGTISSGLIGVGEKTTTSFTSRVVGGSGSSTLKPRAWIACGY